MPKPGSTKARGYSGRHQALRAEYKKRMAAGELFVCWRCGRSIDPTGPFDLGHDDRDRTVYRGPEHVKCNRATTGRNKRPAQLRRWRL